MPEAAHPPPPAGARPYMRGVHSMPQRRVETPMREETAGQARLEAAHQEICTALTILCSNAHLVRVDLARHAHAGDRLTIHAHLTEMDLALDRLRRLASSMRGWHDAARLELPPPAADVRTYIPVDSP